MVSENTDTRRASELRAEAADALDRRGDGNRLAALYGLTPKVESAIVTAIREGAEDRCRALVAPLHPADQADLVAYLRTFSASPANIPEADPTARATDHDLDPAILAIQGDPEYGEYLSSECLTCHRGDGADELVAAHQTLYHRGEQEDGCNHQNGAESAPVPE